MKTRDSDSFRRSRPCLLFFWLTLNLANSISSVWNLNRLECFPKLTMSQKSWVLHVASRPLLRCFLVLEISYLIALILPNRTYFPLDSTSLSKHVYVIPPSSATFGMRGDGVFKLAKIVGSAFSNPQTTFILARGRLEVVSAFEISECGIGFLFHRVRMNY